MGIESLAGMFSQKSGADQSMGSSVMNAIIGFLVQKMMGGGGGGRQHVIWSYRWR
jgi:hypothetical protein